MTEQYEALLKRAYDRVKIVTASSDRFEIPKVTGLIEGKNTIITNIGVIADYLRCDVRQLSKFLQKELATPGRLENNRLILNTKINSLKANEKVQLYAKAFVICPVCNKPDTETITEKNIKFKHCLACGAKSPIRSRI